jgi:hypothetical protein
MRFMMLMIPKGCETALPCVMPDPKVVETMMIYNKTLHKAGVLLYAEALHPPSISSRVSFKNGKSHIIDGPFKGVKENLGGFWMIKVGSRAEAIEWAKKCPASDDDVIEIRQVQEISDYPDDLRKLASGFDVMHTH